MVWFSLALWVYTQTQSVLVLSIMSGIFLVVTAITSIWFGSLVDHHKKKTMMIISSAVSLISFILAFIMYQTFPDEVFKNYQSVSLWIFISTTFIGVLAGNIRGIVLPTITTILVDEENRDKANGMSGTVNGVVFLASSMISGFLLAVSGMFWIFIGTIAVIIASIIHLYFLKIPEKGIVHIKPEKGQEAGPQKMDFLETLTVIKKIPGLFNLIIFTTINNFLGGVFMPLLDPYGLSLVSLQTWGVLWGFLSSGFIIGGIAISKVGLGKNPLRTLFLANLILWIICIFFTIQPLVWLVALGIFIYACIVPFIEASEQTIVQKIVPKERQGRVFGLAQSIEQSASPLTAFAIGPITQFIFIPFMTTGAGVDLIGDWYGVGPGRGIALVFSAAGIIGLVITYLAMKTSSYKILSKQYLES